MRGCRCMRGLPLSLDAAISHSGASFLQWPHLPSINRTDSFSGSFSCLDLTAGGCDGRTTGRRTRRATASHSRTHKKRHEYQQTVPATRIHCGQRRGRTMSLLSSTISLKLSAVSSTTSLDDLLPPPLGLGRSLDPPPLLGLDLDPPAHQTSRAQFAGEGGRARTRLERKM